MSGLYFEKVEIRRHDITYLEVDSSENTSEANAYKPQADDRQVHQAALPRPVVVLDAA